MVNVCQADVFTFSEMLHTAKQVRAATTRKYSFKPAKLTLHARIR